MIKYHFTTPQARWIASSRPAVGLLLTLFLFLGCPSLYAQSGIAEDADIKMRNLQVAEKKAEEPVAPIAEAGDIKVRNLQVAEKKAEEPAAAAVTGSQSSDEYGDVTAEDVRDVSARSSSGKSSDEYGDVAVVDGSPAEPREQIADPIRPFNVAMYHFNDKVYFWVWKPAATGYKYVVPQEVRSLLSNFYQNLKAPVRIINNLFQGEPGYAGIELASFLINSTVGVGGLRNCSQECFGLQGRRADFGQTLGKYGVPFGFYLVLPFMGPSSARDGFGFLVDWAMRPQTYISTEFFSYQSVGLFVHENINTTSFHIGEYEAFKEAAIDPYVAMRDIYIQYRKNLIEKP